MPPLSKKRKIILKKVKQAREIKEKLKNEKDNQTLVGKRKIAIQKLQELQASLKNQQGCARSTDEKNMIVQIIIFYLLNDISISTIMNNYLVPMFGGSL